MGILRSIESRIEGAFEGTFGRAFRANVEPVEIARKLAKELDDGKVVSVSQVYAPNEYTVFLNPKDRARFSEYEASLRTELAVYLAEHARREGYVLNTRPRVLFETDERLSVGEFGIACEIVSPDEAPGDEPAAAAPEPEPEPEPDAEPESPAPASEPEPPAVRAAKPTVEAPIPPPPPVPVPAVEPVPEPEPEPAVESATVQFSAAEAAAAGVGADLALLVDGRRVPVDAGTLVLGRSSACDLVLDDANASRRHAELRRRGDSITIVDLDSTNGTAVNGKRVREQALTPGDKITIGTTTLVLERGTP
jgi:hypothetical protein